MSKALMIAAALATLAATAIAGSSDAEARGIGGGIRSASFRAPISSFRPIGNIGNRINLPGKLLPGKIKLPPRLVKLPVLPPRIPGNPPGLKPKPPVHGGGKGGAVAIGVAIGSGIALAASSECAYPYRKWQETGSNTWKDRYYSCMGY